MLRGCRQAGRQAGKGETSLRRFDRFAALEGSGTHSASVSVGAVCGTGRLDVLLSTGRHWHSPLRLYRNEGGGLFSAGAVVGAEAGYRSYGVPFADLDGSGQLGFVVGTDKGAAKPVFVGDGRGSFLLSGHIDDIDATRNIA